MASLIIKKEPRLKGPGVIQNTTPSEFPTEKNLEVKEVNHPSPHHLRKLHNLNKGIDLPYNLHMLQSAMMQEKCWYSLLIGNVL